METDGGAVGLADCARLLSLDFAALVGEEAVAAMRLAFRVSTWAAAMLDRGLYEGCRAVEGSTERTELDGHSSLEAAAQFGWSVSMADRRLAQAAELIEDFPAVARAMAEGHVEPRKAQAFTDVCQEMTPEHRDATVAAVLPEAPDLPVRALEDRLAEVGNALDADWSAVRLAAALGRARVTHRRNPSGSGELAGRDLPIEDAIRARGHLDAVAQAVHVELRDRGLRPPRRDWVRARVLCRLMDGSLTGLGDVAVVAAIADEIVGELPGDADGPDEGGGPDPSDGGGSGPGPDSGGPGPDSGGSGPDGGPDPGSGPDPDPGVSDPEPPEPPLVPGSRLRQGIVEVRLRLSTLLGLDELGGHAPTWGALGADQARALALARVGGEWRLVMCHPDRRLRSVALLRRRPDHAPRHRRDGRDARAIVELAVTVDELAALDPDEHGPFAAMLREAQHALATAPDPTDPRHPASSHADAARRHPGAELDRYLRVRDRHCIGPACHHPAATAQIDHTQDWITGGPTTAPNTGVPCTRHHDAKTDRRWDLDQPSPGHFRWRSPAGSTFDIRPRPVISAVPAPLRPRTAPGPVPPVVGDEEADVPVPTPTPTRRPPRPTIRDVLTGRAPPASDEPEPAPPY